MELSVRDHEFLESLNVSWDDGPRKGFKVPRTLREYLDLYPDSIKLAVEEAGHEIGCIAPDDSLDDWEKKDIDRLLGSVAERVEDIFKTYPPTPLGKQSRTEHLHAYVQEAVQAAFCSLARELPVETVGKIKEAASVLRGKKAASAAKAGKA